MANYIKKPNSNKIIRATFDSVAELQAAPSANFDSDVEIQVLALDGSTEFPEVIELRLEAGTGGTYSFLLDDGRYANYYGSLSLGFDSVANLTGAVADLVGLVKTGDTIEWRGYYIDGDFGKAIPLVVEATTGGVNSFALSDGRYANLYADGPLNVMWFGAKVDGVTEDQSFVQAGLSAGDIFIPSGTLLLGGTITVPANRTIEGELGTTIKLKEFTGSWYFNCSGNDNITFKNFSVDGNNASFVYAFQTGNTTTDSRSRYSFIYGLLSSNINVRSVKFTDCYSAGIYLQSSLVSEIPEDTGVLIDNCEYSGGYFELCKIVLMGKINITNCNVFDNRNSSGSAALVANDIITTGCSDVYMSNNYLGECDGSGAKHESCNGSFIITGNTFDLNDFQGVHFAESAIERGDVSNHNEIITVTGNNFIKPLNYGVHCESTTSSSVNNVTITGNNFDRCVVGGITVSGDDFVITGNNFYGDSLNRAGGATCPFAILVAQANANVIKNLIITGNKFNQATNIAPERATIGFGQSGAVAFSVEKVLIHGNLFIDFEFRGIQFENQLYADFVTISSNRFYRSTGDGSSSRDINSSNTVHALTWQIVDNIISQSIRVNNTFSGSTVTMFGNRITAAEGVDTANSYVILNGAEETAVYDIGTRLAVRRSSIPTTGEWQRNDIAWNTASAVGSPVGWVCVTAGSPGTWEEIGVAGMVASEASANTASDVGAGYVQAEVQAILDELRDLKTKMRTANLLLT